MARLASHIIRLLKTKAATLSCAESCTGGLVSHQLTNVPGSSCVFKGSIIAYSNAVKASLLSVKNPDLELYGAVSDPVVRQMAANCRQTFQSDYAIAISGIAGPGGGSIDKPVGRVHIAVASAHTIHSEHYTWEGTRSAIKRQAAHQALLMLINIITD